MINCKNVYPHRLVRPLGKYRGLNHQEQLRRFINDIELSEKNIVQFVGDNLKRAFAKLVLCHSSYYPCEYCFSRGVATSIKLRDSNAKKTKITWPYSTARGEPRTREKIEEILENIEELTPAEKKGILGRSLLMDVPEFDIVLDASAEYLHSVCLGVIKRTVELTFNVGEARPRKTKRPLSLATAFNALMSCFKNPREFSRRARSLDFAVLKGAEFRNFSLFYFPLIIECIEEGHEERDLWLYLGYIIRACILPSLEFRYVILSDLEAYCERAYKLYEKLFGSWNCSYNTHVVFSHLTEIRSRGPLTETSSFIFESFYGEMKKCYVPGTISPLKQILEKVFLKRILSNHCCEIPIHYSDHETALENDTLIYVWENNDHKMYMINELVNDDKLLCHPIYKEKYEFEELNNLEWHKVGLYKKGEIDTEQNVVIYKKNVTGKVVEVLNLLITCPNNVLREK